VWGGEKEQEEERAAGNLHAKNWQDEARQIVEETVCSTSPICPQVLLNSLPDGKILEDTTTSISCTHNAIYCIPA
jgi:hypothetical protein